MSLLNPSLSHFNPVHTLSPYFSYIHFNIILPSMPSSFKWSLLFKFSNKKLFSLYKIRINSKISETRKISTFTKNGNLPWYKHSPYLVHNIRPYGEWLKHCPLCKCRCQDKWLVKTCHLSRIRWWVWPIRSQTCPHYPDWTLLPLQHVSWSPATYSLWNNIRYWSCHYFTPSELTYEWQKVQETLSPQPSFAFKA